LVRFRFQKPETGKTPTEPNRFGLRGTINSYKKNHVVFLNPSIHTPAPAVLLLSPKPLSQLTTHNSQFHICKKSIHLHLLDHSQPHPSPTIFIFIFKRRSATSLSRHLHLQTPVSHIPLPPATIFIFKPQSATSLSHTVTPDLES
jgi:hypothetical protein